MSPSSASAGRQLAALLAPVVEETGLDLEDVAVTRVGHRAEVRVLVDQDGGVSLDDVALVSQAIAAVLDLPAADAILGTDPYVLEVSSPGVDRPLVEPRQWRRAAGRRRTFRIDPRCRRFCRRPWRLSSRGCRRSCPCRPT